MAKIALLVPHGEMEVLARETIEEEAFDSLRGEILSVKTIETTNAVAEARAVTHLHLAENRQKPMSTIIIPM